GAAAAEVARRATPVIQAERALAQHRARFEQHQSAVTGERQKVERLALQNDVAYQPDLSSDELQRIVATQIPAVKDAARRAAELQILQTKAAALEGQLEDHSAGLYACDEQEAAHRTARNEAAEAVTRAEAAVDRVSSLVQELAPFEGAERSARLRDKVLAERSQLLTGLEQAKTQLAEITTDITSRSACIVKLQEAVDRLPELASAVTAAEKAANDAVRLSRLRDQLNGAEASYLTASEEHNAKARAFALGVAPRLARQLRDGEACLVCGSTEHPRPAEGDDDQIDQAQMNKAHEHYNQAFATLTSIRDAVAELEANIGPATDVAVAEAEVMSARARLTEAEQARDQSTTETGQLDSLKEARSKLLELTASVAAQIKGADIALAEARTLLGINADATLATLAERADAHRQLLTQARTDADGLADARSRVEAMDAQLALIATRRTELTKGLAANTATLQSLIEQIDKLRASLAEWHDVDLVERETGLDLLLGSLAKLADATDAQSICAERVRAGSEELAAALTRSHLHSVKDAIEAELTDEEIQRLESLYEEFKARSVECDSQLRQLEELKVPDIAPDLDELAEAAHRNQVAATEATSRRVGVQHLVEQSLNLVATSEERIEHIAALTEIADRKTQVARLCDAKGASKIGLEGFILRSHLHDVVIQANIRLDNLSNGRYQMVLAEEALSAQGEWGLDLTIIDSHTGTERPVTTLSGGETFYTSLSLALGLSDVLSNRGATTISSVFIDEGFGALDDNAIDDTIDVLNQLRSDGVTIGVITHVGALRDALPAGISVQKLPSGGSRVIQAA
ncbi:MAG: SbcC/MukB-like Walker B domain-containing protein, partial [Acidimicrobiales bacterium]